MAKILLSVFLNTFLLVGCENGNSCSLEMEAFYFVFGSSSDFDVLYKAKVENAKDFQFDEDVYLYFKCINKQLIFLRMEHVLTRKHNEYALKGKVYGFDNEKGVLLITFDFSSIKFNQLSDYVSLKYTPNRTPIVRIWFSTKENNLCYEKYEYVKTLNKKPIRLK